MQVLKYIILLFFILSFSHCKKDKKNPFEDLFTLLLLQNLLGSQDAPCADSTDTPSDSFYSSQWHLLNTGSTASSLSGEDAKAVGAWAQGCKGGGVNIVVVDDGMDTNHEDLKSNYTSSYQKLYGGSFYSTGTCTSSTGCHGTAVAGIMAAEQNSLGVVGIASKAKVSPRNVLFNATDVNSGDAMSTNTVGVFISNNSWGAADNMGLLFPSGSFWRSGIDTALSTGRNGKGTVFFWAAGNGGRSLTAYYGLANSTNIYTDNSNYDGQANYYGVNAVCAVGNDGKKASYSEDGANLLVCAHSLGNTSVGIFTTDVSSTGGYNRGTSSTEPTNLNYTSSFSGTSAASPLAAGVGALVVDANPSLTWRDVRVILARSARQNDPSDSGWFTNGAGLKFNHKYGFGAADANAAVTLAKSWALIGSEVQKAVTGSTTNASVANNSATGATNTVAVSSSGIGKVEFVDLTLTVTTGATDDPGDLQIELTSPSGKTAILSIPRACINSTPAFTRCTDFTGYRFGVTTFMDESADGTWSLKVSDLCNAPSGTTRTCTAWGGQVSPGLTNNGTHTISSWSMNIRGRAN
ncbi:S8 family serine peptidase [Leptospira ilyithenensis]|uniref:Serine protease n=1 Tax=Leptospira ilyithenensis TaxID=2484901 RepID=A0A4R9LRW8_9LEPT|nr:S8 family serine peptidase [Leptospira ilyithenensis]TGN11142.1 serine protease [Leptospira ilyithenensis]